MSMVQAVVCVGEAGINALATIRALGRRGVPVHAVSVAGSPQIATLSRYCSGRTEIADLAGLHPALLALGRGRARRPVLYVDNDAMMKALAPHAEALAEAFEVVDAIGEAGRLTDKAYQLRVAKEAGIPVPRTWFPRSWDELLAIGRETSKTLIAKPSPERFAAGVRPDFKAVIAAAPQELARGLRSQVGSPEDVLVQEFIEGGDEQIYAALCYRAKSVDRCFVLSARKLRQTQPGAGVMAVGQAVDAPQVREMSRRLVRRLGVRGVISTEFKLDPRDGKHYFIEWNPRPAYFQSLGWKSGFDLAWLAYCDRAYPERLPTSLPVHPGRHHWVNFHGDLMHLMKAPRRALEARSWRPYLGRTEWAVFALDDLGPWLRATRQMAGWLGRKLLRKLGSREQAEHNLGPGGTRQRPAGVP